MPYRHCILLHRRCVLLHRHCVCCTGTVFCCTGTVFCCTGTLLCCTPQASRNCCSSLLWITCAACCLPQDRRHIRYGTRRCCSNMLAAATTPPWITSLGSAFKLPKPLCARNNIQRPYSKRLYSATLHSVSLYFVHFTSCMYMHGFTLVLLYMYMSSGCGQLHPTTQTHQ